MIIFSPFVHHLSFLSNSCFFGFHLNLFGCWNTKYKGKLEKIQELGFMIYLFWIRCNFIYPNIAEFCYNPTVKNNQYLNHSPQAYDTTETSDIDDLLQTSPHTTPHTQSLPFPFLPLLSSRQFAGFRGVWCWIGK